MDIDRREHRFFKSAQTRPKSPFGGPLRLIWVWACVLRFALAPPPSPQLGGFDLNSSSRICARLGSGVAPPLGVVEKEVAVLVVLVRRHRRAVGAAVRWAVDDEVPGAVEEEAGPAALSGKIGAS